MSVLSIGLKLIFEIHVLKAVFLFSIFKGFSDLYAINFRFDESYFFLAPNKMDDIFSSVSFEEVITPFMLYHNKYVKG